MDTKYFTCAETAVLIRKALKASFPVVKFSVRSKTYSGGASINVHWLDGPMEKAVERVAGAFAGKDFDGSIDMSVPVEAYLDADGKIVGHESRGTAGSMGYFPAFDDAPEDAQRVHFGAGYVFCRRDLSPAEDRRLKEAACKRHGIDPAIIGTTAWDLARSGCDSMHTWAWREGSGYYDAV